MIPAFPPKRCQPFLPAFLTGLILWLASASLPAQSYRIVNAANPAPSTPVHAALPRLPDPPPAKIAAIQQSFLQKEEHIRQLLRHDYTYKESIVLDELDSDGNIIGNYKQKDDILFNNSGQRNIVCTWCPQPTLDDQVGLDERDLQDFFDMYAFSFKIHDLAQYQIRYLGHYKLDQLTAYEFAISPKRMLKGRHYFQGHVWVDDVSLQIVKADGQDVPNLYDKHGHITHFYLPFKLYYQPVENKYWFPAFNEQKGPVPDSMSNISLRMIIRFSDYKRYVATHTFTPMGPVPKP